MIPGADMRENNCAVPGILKGNIIKIFLLSAAVPAVSAVLYASLGFPASFLIMGMLLSLSLNVMALLQYRRIKEGRFKVYDGRCIDSQAKGPAGRTREIVFECGGKEYAIRVSQQRKFRLLPGDRFRLYTADDAVEIETDGVTEILSFYAIERHL